MIKLLSYLDGLKTKINRIYEGVSKSSCTNAISF